MDKTKENPHAITYTVNGENQSTTEKELTPVQIIKNAGLDPESNYLIELKGNQQISYKDKPNESIKMHNNMKFITNFIGPTPVA